MWVRVSDGVYRAEKALYIQWCECCITVYHVLLHDCLHHIFYLCVVRWKWSTTWWYITSHKAPGCWVFTIKACLEACNSRSTTTLILMFTFAKQVSSCYLFHCSYNKDQVLSPDLFFLYINRNKLVMSRRISRLKKKTPTVTDFPLAFTKGQHPPRHISECTHLTSYEIQYKSKLRFTSKPHLTGFWIL